MTLPVQSQVGLPAAPESDGVDNASPQHQFITFRIGEEEYGVDILSVHEIRVWAEVTRLPNTPEFVLGVLNMRGIILPVFDLRRRFGMGQTTPTERHVIIVVSAGEKMIGVLVDKVAEILALEPSEVQPVPEMGFTIDEEFLLGLASVKERMVALVDVAKLFDLDMLLAGVEVGSEKH